MRKKGFTLVELLVVIAIIAMLLAILMPALNKVRQIAYRMVCGSNLAGLGKACMTYSNDYAESLPVFGPQMTSGGQPITWGPLTGIQWDDPTSTSTTGATQVDMSKVTKAGVTQCMFLLVKYADVSTGSYVCKATSAKKFEITQTSGSAAYTTKIKDVTEGQDFGKETSGSSGPWDYVSYSYALPYRATASGTGPYALTASSPAGLAVMADSNPWQAKGKKVNKAAQSGTTATAGPVLLIADWLAIDGSTKSDKNSAKYANSANHQNEGQNVLYMDAHVSFETLPNVGIQQDNIYTPWTAAALTAGSKDIDRQGGAEPTGPDSPAATTGQPQSAEDSYLVN